MCDISPKTRRKRYKQLKKAGHTSAFASRAKDFSEKHFKFHVDHAPEQL